MQALERVRYALVAQLDRVTDYESVGRGFESLPAYQKRGHPFGCPLFWYAGRMDSKGRPCQRQGKQVSGGQLLSPWESPWISECDPQDRKTISILFLSIYLPGSKKINANRIPFAVPGRNFARQSRLVSCRPLHTLCPRFFCHRQRSGSRSFQRTPQITD